MNAKAAQSAPPQHHGTDLATTPPQPLTLQQRAMAALGERDEVELRKLAAGTQDITVITNAAGYQQVHSARMVLKNKRISIEKDAKKARQDAIDFGKAVIIEERRLIDILAGEETRLEKLQTEWDEARKREKEAKEAAERARIAAIQERIDWIREQAAEAVGQPSAVIQERIETLVAYPIDGTFVELEKQAEGARATTLIRLRAQHEKAQAHEEQQRQLAAERLRLAEEREAAERAQAAERARIAEEERVAKVARAAEAARQAEEDRKARQTLEAERKVQAETLRRQQEAQAAETARLRREQEAAAAVERERIAAEEAALQERIEAQRAKEEERIRQQELEDAARAAEAARLAQAQADFEEAREAFKAAQERPAAAVVDEPAPESASVAEVAEDPFRPTDEAIVHLVMTTYNVSVPTAIQWLREMDFETVGV